MSTAPVPEQPSLASLRAAAADCRACALWTEGTQTVFGAGLRRARLMLVGEQPGDREDLAGEPFVGPAGGVLDRALAQAGIARADAYVTNVVKHFHHETRGKRRIHQRPESAHVKACRPWLDAELAVVEPEVVVCLGAVAAKALLGPKVRVTVDRGRLLDSALPARVAVTIHPSSILRAPDHDAREAAFAGFVDDLRFVAGELVAT